MESVQTLVAFLNRLFLNFVGSLYFRRIPFPHIIWKWHMLNLNVTNAAVDGTPSQIPALLPLTLPRDQGHTKC